MDPHAIDCHVDDATGRLAPDALGWVRDRVHAASVQLCREHGVPGGEVRARIIDDAAMEAAHVEYLDTPGTTDVITFDLAGGMSGVVGEASEARRPLDADGLPDTSQALAPPAPIDVDMLLCLDEAERQARERGHEAAKELLLYALHGVLHCLGYDDHDEASFAAMHEAEDRVLSAIGVGPLFASDEAARAREANPGREGGVS